MVANMLGRFLDKLKDKTGCAFDGGETGSTGIVKTILRPKATMINANDNVASRQALAA